MAEDGTGSGTGSGTGTGTGTGDAPAFSASLPETIRSHEAFKDVKDVGDLGDRYIKAITPKAFADQLPDDIKGEAVFADIKDLAGLAKSYHAAQKMIGVPKDQLLRLPATDKPEDWAPVYQRLGRPEKAADYKLAKLPEGLAIDENFQKGMLEVMHTEGLTQKQVEKVFAHYHGGVAEALKAAGAKTTADMATASQALKTEFGAAYDQKMAGITKVVDHLDKLAGGTLKKDLEATGLGNHPGLAKAFDKLAAMFQEDGIIGRATGSDVLSSPTEAKQKIAALRTDAQWTQRYMNKSANGHKEAVAQMEALFKQAYPEQGQAA